MSTLRRILLIVIVLTAGCTRPQPVSLRVLSYNIHHGEGLDGTLDLERIARIVRESGADLVAVQEVDRGAERTRRLDQPARLSELTGMRVVFEKNIDLEDGEYGNAILSRLPVESHDNHRLPTVPPNEQRGLLEVRVRVAGRPLLFFATHLQVNDERERFASAEQFRDLVGERPDLPIILAGDLNAKPDSRVLGAFYSFLLDTCPPGLKDAFTAPAGKPAARIDYILYTGDRGLRAVDYRVLPEPVASDHRPVLAAFLLE